MFKVFCLLFLLFLVVGANAQDEENLGKALYLELGGKGFFSANIDFALGNKDRLALGITVLDHEFAKKESEEEYPTLTLPTPSIMYFHLFGNRRHYFEVGGGASISPVLWRTYSPNDSPITLHGSIGYRYQVVNRFFFRAGFTPLYRINWMFLPLAGLSFGYSW